MNKEQIANTLKDYHWMVATLADKRNMMITSAGLVAKGGIESSLPSGQGQHSDPVFNEVTRREKQNKFTRQLEEKVLYIQQAVEEIDNPKDQAVLHYLLLGKSYMEIAIRLDLSKDEVRWCRKRIIKAISEHHDSHNSPNVDKGEKTSVKCG
ncbi:helix-turn-helix transcriptional regulator [Jeotgalibacillus haloalkalitolerans]|uniref:DNA-binding response regulator n=1 Tax=Jeotgalibacillus haloalkalitolerans TaxID=3104292 RepID=A0ABU5KKN9_9BACL|nr:DNA-binding response regulator [Jeotgalibacillus sp. HH7-29]MDZ5711643.1 DNA-binding response regulator [Jeotgalibacillus sp. HH7-29]